MRSFFLPLKPFTSGARFRLSLSLYSLLFPLLLFFFSIPQSLSTMPSFVWSSLRLQLTAHFEMERGPCEEFEDMQFPTRIHR